MEPLTHYLWIGFAGGLLAFAHCLGMCGGFVLHLSQEKNKKRMVTGQLLWQAGKLSSYMFLGAMAGYAGRFLELLFFNHGQFQNLLSYASGGIILFMGLSLLGLLPVRGKVPGSAGVTVLAGLIRKFFTASSPGAAFSLGMATGFLPCPIILAFLVYSLQSGSVLTGMATMGALSLGTMLPLLLLGGITRLTGLHLRSWGPKAGGIILILLGLTTALRGTAIYHHLLGCPPKPALHQAQSNEIKPCCAEVPGNGSGN
jgi:uncharacterized protein